MSDLLKVRVGGSDYLCKWTDPNFVVIGGRKYKTVKIGSQIWMAENLDWKFDVNGSQIPIGGSGSPTIPHAWYYDNDEASYGIDGTYKCGLLYNWYAVNYLEQNKSLLLPDEWHVPTQSEFEALVSTVGINPGTKLKALDNSVTSDWPSNWNGTDVYRFKALPAGFYLESSFRSLGTGGYWWTSSNTQPGYNSANMKYMESISVEVSNNNIRYMHGLSLRLVKSLS